MDRPINQDDINSLKIDLETLDVQEFMDKHNPIKDLSGKRFAYTIIISSTDEEGNFIPCIAIEDESGYYPMKGRGAHSTPWTWGKDYNKANEIADKMNEKMGISKREAFKIIASSMFHGIR